ncbi:peptide maturation system acyl carrier-related protein [Ruminiclostridium herbifermentans]|uniref:Peptide maturation system acyl carrier-related protein n=1 Tax=Ruminiclostridium herbifermentans TaxID=2488810 RepID=A0A4U7JJ57_9FIRM|nr:peptide maturation system acyl carrier-related protein [Ruminiclostridium herbifermentans]QNU67328.1 peptide maturation system acyl carrier-related protein [Ruminiclostridium herbifermentans]
MDNLLESQVKAGLFRIFKDRFNINLNELGEEYFEKSILGKDFQLSARDLLYIYFDIKKEFNIIIPEEDIASGKFSTLKGLIEMVANQKLLDKVSV